MLTKIRNLENQDVLSCHAAAVVEEVEADAAAAAAGSHSKIGKKNERSERLLKSKGAKQLHKRTRKLFDEGLIYCYNL